MKKTPIILLLSFLISCSSDLPSSSTIISSSNNYVTVTFDSRGGTNVAPQEVETNNLLFIPNVTNEGNTLDGWYTSINGGTTLENKWNFFSDRANFDFTLYAKWIINQYTITFETNGGNSIQTETNNFHNNLSIPTPTKVGHSFEGWFTDVGTTQAFTLTKMPSYNLTLYAKWTINQYTINFQTNGGSFIASITANYGEVVSPPVNPTRQGYTFNGWYSNEELTEIAIFPNVIPNGNINLYASWLINQYTITFETNGGNSLQTQTYNFSASLTVPTPTKVGHAFKGWFNDIELTEAFNLSSMPASNLTLYAYWIINQYSINFETNGGNSIPSIIADYGDTVIPPLNPTKEGYVFGGWYSNPTLTEATVIPNIITAANLTLYANWINLDQNHYRLIGGQANIGGWIPANAPVMTRATGTNSYSWTGDLYENSTWKLVIGTDWANGEVGPMSAGLSIIDKGVTWTKDADGALGIPADSNTGFDIALGGVGNFKTLVDGSYTVNFVSLPALTRTITIVRNGNPKNLSPNEWSLVGTMNAWIAQDKSLKLTNIQQGNELYKLTLNLYQDEEFKFVKNASWGGDLGYSSLVNPNANDIINNYGNIKVVRDGSYEIELTVGAITTTTSVERVGDLARLAGGLFLVGTVTTPEWTPSDTSLSLADTNGDGKYYGVFTLGLNKEFKLKSGTAWDVGFDAGFDRVASMPTGAFADAGGSIKVLVGTPQLPDAFLIETRIVGDSVRIVISPAWRNYGFPSMNYAPTTGTSIGYLNTNFSFWEANAQLSIYTFDGAKTSVIFDFTGVAGHEYLFKIEQRGQPNAVEARVVATGARQTFTLDLSGKTVEQRALFNLFVFFHTAPTNPVSGTIVVHGWSYPS
jgi:uncharacterized repeat protein (TIGR02543 family)